MRALIAMSVALLATACPSPLPLRECQDDADCGGGTCLPAQHGSWCAYPAPGECDSGMKWGPLAGESLAQQCVIAGEPEIIDAGCQADCLPAPTLRFPWNGYATGSVWASGPREPTFRWAAVEDATGYELAIADRCDGFPTCSLPTSADVYQTDQTTFRSPPLPVASAPGAPVGTRYYWQVRACDAHGCYRWSAPRYLDVGRQASDFDGDGYADVLVGAPNKDVSLSNVGRVSLYRGGVGASFDVVADGMLTGTQAAGYAGSAVASAGDVNGDGYADVLVGAPYGGPDREGQVMLHAGSADGVLSEPEVLTGELNGDRFGDAVASAGDVNGDGFADLVIGAPRSSQDGTSSGRVYVQLGAPEGTSLPPPVVLTLPGDNRLLGSSVSGVGDMDGDGFADIAVATGAFVLLYRGGAGDTFDDQSDATFAVESSVSSISAAGDVNGDGFADLLVGARRGEVENVEVGLAFFFLGGAAPVDIEADLRLQGSSAGANFGKSVAFGDVDADGHSDLIVGESTDDIPDATGRAHVYLGAPASALDDEADLVLSSDVANDRFGHAVGAPGDLNGDGTTDLCIGVPRRTLGSAGSVGRATVFFGAAGGLIDAVADGLLPGAAAGDMFGSSLNR